MTTTLELGVQISNGRIQPILMTYRDEQTDRLVGTEILEPDAYPPEPEGECAY